MSQLAVDCLLNVVGRRYSHVEPILIHPNDAIGKTNLLPCHHLGRVRTGWFQRQPSFFAGSIDHLHLPDRILTIDPYSGSVSPLHPGHKLLELMPVRAPGSITKIGIVLLEICVLLEFSISALLCLATTNMCWGAGFPVVKSLPSTGF